MPVATPSSPTERAPTSQAKILPYAEAPSILRELKEQGRTIVQCHGTFDLLHPGHFCHLEDARALGDVLVVTITGEKHVNKGPGRPFFGDELRCKSLAALEYVDYVVVIPFPAAVEAVECVKPDVYCKGLEYKNPEVDVTGNIHDDLTTVQKHGGRIEYVGSVVFSSTRILNNLFDAHSPSVKEFLSDLAERVTPDQFKGHVEGFSNLRCLVIGDIIFDRYTTVNVQGLTSKNRILSGRMLGEETHAGGALASFRHLHEFTSHVKLVSLAGSESWVSGELDRYLTGEENQVLRIENFTTIVKQRFVEPISEGYEMSKLFSVNLIDEAPPSSEVEEQLIQHIRPLLSEVDFVLVMDFGHGVMGSRVREFIQQEAPSLCLNCQTNSNNYGFNIINRRYQRADCFSLDRSEMSLAVGKPSMNYAVELRRLQEQLKARYAWLTLGSEKTFGRLDDGTSVSCAPFEKQVTDTIGAGDAFCAVASLAATRKLDIDLATFMAQLAGALAVKIPGNRDSIRKSRFLKAGMTMLNF